MFSNQRFRFISLLCFTFGIIAVVKFQIVSNDFEVKFLKGLVYKFKIRKLKKIFKISFGDKFRSDKVVTLYWNKFVTSSSVTSNFVATYYELCDLELCHLTTYEI